MDTIILYRAVDEDELEDILRFADYGLSPHGGGKYFALTLGGVERFANNPFNADQRLTITAISIPRSFLALGYQFNDPDGAGSSIHFADEVLTDLYEVSGLPQILSARWVPIIGGGQDDE